MFKLATKREPQRKNKLERIEQTPASECVFMFSNIGKGIQEFKVFSLQFSFCCKFIKVCCENRIGA